MFATTPRGKWFVLFTAFVAALLFTTPTFAVDETQALGGFKISTTRQLALLRRSVFYMRRSIASLRRRNDSLSQGITDVKSSLITLNQRVISGTSVEPTNPQIVIGANASASNYITFDFYPGVIAEAVAQHKGTGIVVMFKTKEGAKTLMEYKLELLFAGRTADQKAADAMMVNTCLTNFYRAADARNGGSFYIYPSADDKIGLACSSTTNS